MTQRTPQELKGLTIKRLQALLKAARARYMAVAICQCCGEYVVYLYNKDNPLVKRIAPLKAYYESVKVELKRRQR